MLFRSIKTLDCKEQWKKLGNEINWHPTFMKARYDDWVENLSMDWCISRQKYFGVPIPVWYCKKCGTPIVADEKDLPVNPLVDAPKKVCKCGCTEYEPEIDILDTWATSSVTPQINCKWKVDDETFKKLYPMSLRPNAHDIIRTWDFYTIVKGFYHNNARPWDNLMIMGFLMADKGQKVSKSKNNSKHSTLDFIKNYTADVVRYWTTSSGLGRDIMLNEDTFKNGAKVVNKLYNAGKFIWQFLEGYKPVKTDLLPMDKWIIAKYNKMFENFTKNFDKYEFSLAMNELETFFWNFCDNYIEIAKNRLWKPEVYGEKAKQSAQYTSYIVFYNMLKLFGIFLPHVSEEIYQNTFKENEKFISIHSTTIGKIEEAYNPTIIADGDLVVNDIVGRVRQFKSENKISLKTEIEDITVTNNNLDFIKACEEDIKAVMSIHKINYKTGEFDIAIGKVVEEN